MKRANAIVEYSILLMIVVSATWAMQGIVKRSIQARIKQETDRQLRNPYPTFFLWQGSVTWSTQDTNANRAEVADRGNGGQILAHTTNDSSFTTLVPPTPPYVPVAGLHIQDAASPAPKQENPKDGGRENEPDETTED